MILLKFIGFSQATASFYSGKDWNLHRLATLRSPEGDVVYSGAGGRARLRLVDGI